MKSRGPGSFHFLDTLRRAANRICVMTVLVGLGNLSIFSDSRARDGCSSIVNFVTSDNNWNTECQ